MSNQHTPEPGQTVYSEHGTEATYISNFGGKHIVKPRYFQDGDDGEFWEGSAEEWPSVFPTPPIERTSAELAELRKEISDARTELHRIRDERSLLDVEHKERMAKFKRHEQLQLLEDFLDGKITHYATFDYSGPKIIPLDQAVSSEERYHKNLRLLSLYGGTKGDLSWRLGYYSDPSGGSIYVIPCTSEAAAVEVIRKRAEEAFELWKNKKDVRYGETSAQRFAEAAGKFGYSAPAELLAEMKAQELAGLRKSVEERKRQLAVDEAKLQAALLPAPTEARA